VSTVSATTRAPRPGEVDGRDYHFLAREEFDRRVAAGGFAEWAEVHGNRYGTLHSELERWLAAGRDILLQLDVQGMRSLKRLHPGTVGVFLAPPSLGELERRLRARGGRDSPHHGGKTRRMTPARPGMTQDTETCTDACTLLRGRFQGQV